MSALTARVYSAANQAGSALHTMAVFQRFQGKLLHAMDESGLDPAAFKDNDPDDQQYDGQSGGTQVPPMSQLKLLVLKVNFIQCGKFR